MKYFLLSSYIDQFAKFYISVSFGETYSNVVLTSTEAARCGRTTTPSVHGAGSGRELWCCYIAFTRMCYVKTIVRAPIVSFVSPFSHCYRVSPKVAFPALTVLFTQVRKFSATCTDTNALARGSWFAWLSPHENKGQRSSATFSVFRRSLQSSRCCVDVISDRLWRSTGRYLKRWTFFFKFVVGGFHWKWSGNSDFQADRFIINLLFFT